MVKNLGRSHLSGCQGLNIFYLYLILRKSVEIQTMIIILSLRKKKTKTFAAGKRHQNSNVDLPTTSLFQWGLVGTKMPQTIQLLPKVPHYLSWVPSHLFHPLAFLYELTSRPGTGVLSTLRDVHPDLNQPRDAIRMCWTQARGCESEARFVIGAFGHLPKGSTPLNLNSLFHKMKGCKGR